MTFTSATFALSRLIYSDLETQWIASSRSIRTLGIVIATNGLLTAVGIVTAAPLGPSAMILGSSLGNIVASILIASLGRWRIGPAGRDNLTRESFGFGFSTGLAVIYSRIDLLIIAILGVNLHAVAVYGVITRVFDALGQIRGSIAQLESRSLAALTTDVRFAQTVRVTRRVVIITGGVAALGTLVCALVIPLPIFHAWDGNKDLFFIACAALVAYFLHLATTALVYADRRSHLLLVGSLAAALGATVVKFLLITGGGIGGAVAAIGVSEALRFSIFLWLYRTRCSNRLVLGMIALAAGAAAIPVVTSAVFAQ